jgi:hypothetical protein
VTARHSIILAAAVAGALSLAACGEASDTPTPAGAQPPAAAPERRALDDPTSNLPAEWPAAEAMREAEAFPAHGSPWYPTPAPATTESPEDPCMDRPAVGPHRC